MTAPLPAAPTPAISATRAATGSVESPEASRVSSGIGVSAAAAERSELRARFSSWRTAPPRHAEGERDLLVAATLELAQQDGVALALRERLDRHQHVAQPLAALERLVGPLDAVDALVQLVVAQAAVAQSVERRVVRDPVQPGPQVELRAVAVHRLVGLHERLLHHVLGALRRQQARHVAHQRAAVALDDRLEGRLGPGADEVHQALVRLRGEHGPAGQPGWVKERSRGHGPVIGVNMEHRGRAQHHAR